MNRSALLSVRALRTRQAADLDVFAFFVRGDEVMKIADISRLHRDENQLRGFLTTRSSNSLPSLAHGASRTSLRIGTDASSASLESS